MGGTFAKGRLSAPLVLAAGVAGCFAPVEIVHDQPIAALIPALVFAIAAVAARRSRGRLSWHVLVLSAVAVLWAAFFPYELHMHQWEKTVHAPIRADLLLLTPVYWIASVAGLVAAIKALRGRQTTEPND